MSSIFTDYMDYASADPSTDYAKLPDAMAKYISSPRRKRRFKTAAYKDNQRERHRRYRPGHRKQSAFRHYRRLCRICSCQRNGPYGPEPLPGIFPEYLEERLKARRSLMSSLPSSQRDHPSKVKITPEQAQRVAKALLDAYSKYATENNLPDPKALEVPSRNIWVPTEQRSSLLKLLLLPLILDEITKTSHAKNVNGMTSRWQASSHKGIEKAIKMVVERSCIQHDKGTEGYFLRLWKRFVR